MTRVLIITTNFPRWEGDPHSPWLVELLGLLRAQGLHFDVLAPAFAGQGSHRVHGLAVQRFRYAPARWETLTHGEGAPNKIRRNPLYLALLPGYLLAGCWAAWRLARHHRYDVIHVHWPMPQAILALAARAARPARLVATFYGADLVLTRRFPALRGLLRALVRRSDAVAAISSFTAAELTEATGVVPQLIPYGIALPDAALHWPAEPGLILAVGRLIPRKGQRYLIEAMARLTLTHPAARLLLVGDGPERAALAAQIAALGLDEQVTLAGRVSDEELQAAYQRCAIFVLPSIIDDTGDTEMLGMVSLEAMRYRKPVVATDVGGVADIVQHEISGLLVAQRNPAALAAAIAQLLNDPARAQSLGDAGYDFARRQFSWEAVTAHTLQLYGVA
ncbi:MAG: glycosyltransferase [Caldilineales bacterium]